MAINNEDILFFGYVPAYNMQSSVLLLPVGTNSFLNVTLS